MATDEKEVIKCAKRMKYTDKFSDVVLIVDNQEIAVHRQILALRSEYFEIMFYGNLDDGHKNRIKIDDVQLSPFKKLINYIYTGKLMVKPIEAPEIYSAAHLLSLPDVTESLSIFMLDNLCKDYFAEYINCAYKYGLPMLADACTEFCVANFKGVEDKISSLSEDAIMGFLCSKMNSNSEMTKFNLTRSWLKANDETKAKMLMGTIKLSNLTIEQIQLIRPFGYFTDTELLDAVFNINDSDKQLKHTFTAPLAATLGVTGSGDVSRPILKPMSTAAHHKNRLPGTPFNFVPK